MKENVLTFRTGKVTVLGKTSLSYAEVRELCLLFDQLGEISAIAGESLRSAGPSPTGTGLQSVTELTARLDVLVSRAKNIVN